MRGRWLGLLAVLLGIVTAGSIYAYLGAAEKRLAAGQETVPVLVAKQDLPARARISAAMVEVRQLPRTARLTGALEKPQQAVGTLTITPLYAGEQLLPGRLAGGSTGNGGLSFRVEKGYRAVAIPVDASRAVSGLLRPGDRVDVAVVTEEGQGSQKQRVAITPVQNALVLAVNQQQGEAGKENGATAEPKTVTLQVTPAGAQALAMAAEEGRFRLTLRPADEQGTTALPRLGLVGLVQGGENGGL